MKLIQALVAQVRLMVLGRPLLVAVDGLASYIKAVHRSFRSPLHTGKQGHPRLVAWPEFVLVQLLKRRQQGELTIEQRVVQGSQALVQRLLRTSRGGSEINTAYIERLNATFRQRLICLVRRSEALTRTPDSLMSYRTIRIRSS